MRPALAVLRSRLAAHRNAVLCAPPGSGKTTLVPLALLGEPWLDRRTILMLEPRRLAARAAAGRLAELSGGPLGGLVGYRVRLDSKVSAATRIEVVTEGILTRRLQRDPELSGVGLVIFDEFHERNLQSDLALALCLDVQQGLREDLRLLVMSATLDAAPIAGLLADAVDDDPVVRADGRSYPVEIRHLDRDPPAGDLAGVTAAAVVAALAEHAGDLLVFLPGAAEIRRVADRLVDTFADRRDGDGSATVVVRPLFGDLAQADQDRALRPDPDGRRRVVLATDIAESSLTIDGVAVVIDAGLARRPRFDPNSGLSGLITRRVSRASAVQRAGRAGRLMPGTCYRLWSSGTERGLVAHDPPEVCAADLAPLVLELAVWGADPGALAWLDRPPAAALAVARALLQDLAALDQQGRPTARGRAMAELPLHPRLAGMLLEAAAQGYARRACRLAALVGERDIVRRSSDPAGGLGCDLDLRLSLLDGFADRRARPDGRALAGFDPAAAKRVLRVADQWARLLGAGPDRGDQRPTAGELLCWAYPDRVARRRDPRSGRYKLANGRGARLAEFDPLAGSDWLVVAHLDAADADGRIHLAAAIEPQQVRSRLAGRIVSVERIAWNDREQAVGAFLEERLGALRLSACPIAQPDLERQTDAMLEGIARLGLAALPWTPAARQLQARVANARQWCPGSWPDLSDQALAATLGDWLRPYLQRVSRRSQLDRLDLVAILRARLDWPAQQALDRLLPTHLQVPSGSCLPLEYRLDGPPVLAVRLQEMFGCAQTPAVCENAVPVLVHLLSPARRPVQVTRDLAGFWQRTYAEVKKELKGRYPKHYWPDDPATAVATARVRPGRATRT